MAKAKKTTKKKASKRKPAKKAAKRYTLVDAQAMHRKHPKTFEVPSKQELDAVKPGWHVKAAFKAKGGDKATERMWVKVDKVSGDTITGKLDNTPLYKGTGLRHGSTVTLKKRNAYDILRPGATASNGGSSRGSTHRNVCSCAMANPKSKFADGDIVRYTANFLRSTGQVAGAPINGRIEGFSDLKTVSGDAYPMVRWSDRDEPVPVHPGNLEMDPRWRRPSSRNPRLLPPGKRPLPGEKRRLPFAIAYQRYAMVDSGFLNDLSGKVGGDDHDLEDVHIAVPDNDHLLVIGTLVTYDTGVKQGGEADDAAAVIWSSAVGYDYPEIRQNMERTTIDAFDFEPEDEDIEWFPDDPPQWVLSPYLKSIGKLLREIPGGKETSMSKKNPKGPYRSIEQIKRANAKAGLHWFEPATLRFFNSEIYPDIYQGRFFITRERMDERMPWGYSIRMANDDGSIDTVGNFRAFTSLEDAQHAASGIRIPNPGCPMSERNRRTFANAKDAWGSCKTVRNKAPLISIDAQGRVCGRPGPLTSKERYKLPAWAFALPGRGPRSKRRYPLYTIDKGRVVPSKTHAINAKGRAKQSMDKGEITKAQYDQIVKSANKVIRLCKDQKTRRNAGVPARLTTGYLNDRRINFPDVRLEFDPSFKFESIKGNPDIQVAYLDGEAVGWVARQDIPVDKRHYPDATSRAAALLGSRSHGGKRKSKRASEAGRLMGRVGQAEIKKKLKR